jgi:hypothetical protein
MAGRQRRNGSKLLLVTDQVVFERDELPTAAGQAFRVFTP